MLAEELRKSFQQAIIYSSIPLLILVYISALDFFS